jgi:hypothetical protein
MRLIAVMALALACSGCFAFEEIDKGYAIMEAHTPSANKQKKQQEEEAQKVAAAKPGEAQPSWWDNARTLGPREKGGSDPMVSCRVQGGTRFMQRSACLAAGGSPTR